MKPITIIITIILAVIIFTTYTKQSQQAKEIKKILAIENKKAVDTLMGELYQAGVSSISNVPANGKWYDEVTFQKINVNTANETEWTQPISYMYHNKQFKRVYSGRADIVANYVTSFKVRRLAKSPSIIEIEIVFNKKNSVLLHKTNLVANFKIKLRNK